MPLTHKGEARYSTYSTVIYFYYCVAIRCELVIKPHVPC